MKKLIPLFLCCSLVAGFGLDDLGDVVDVITGDEVETVLELGEAFSEAASELSDSEEYYLGRAVAANIFSIYSPADSPDFQEYLNKVGTAVAIASPRPVLYGGWHFLLLDSDDINAMACPGGLVFVCRGLLDLTENEDELACVLAHEIAHVYLKHGLTSIENAQWLEAFSLLGSEAADRYGSENIQELSNAYGDIVTDITSSLITKGYSRESEKEADEYAILIAGAAGYDPSGLKTVLGRMAGVIERSGPGFWQTHPSPEDRLEDVESTLEDMPVSGPDQKRTQRFQEMIAVLDNMQETVSSGGESTTEESSTGRGGRESSGSGRTGTSGTGR
jgi:predicted Zn-dependent protease